MTRFTRAALIVIAAFTLSGCARELVDSPYVLAGKPEAFADVPPEFQTASMPIFYITDRAPEGEGQLGPKYGSERSREMRFGVTRVEPRPDVDWETFVADSTSINRRQSYRLRLGQTEEMGTISDFSTRLRVVDGKLALTEKAIAEAIAEGRAMEEALAPWTDAGATDALVFVHGFNNKFHDAVFRTAEMWHFSGRSMIPISYSWPAGRGLSLIGYNADRESSEFTVMHLKMLLYMLAENPRIERIHIVAHSRGTEVALSAVHELFLEFERGRGISLARDAKLSTLVLAAVDIDLEVFRQRFFASNTLMAPGHFVLYFSRHDSAIGWAKWLFGGSRRVGSFKVEELAPESSELLQQLSNLDFVDCDLRKNKSSHSYVFEDPAVLSDLILVLRENAIAGGPERPLGVPVPGAWQITDDYLKPEPAK